MHSKYIARLNIITAGMLFLMLLLILKLFFVQVIHSKDYESRANRQYILPAGSIYDRGSIFLTTKEGNLVAGATLSGGFKIAMTPEDIIDGEKLFEKLSPLIPNLDKSSFLIKVAKKDDPYEEIATHVTKEVADAISIFKEKGITIYQEKWRYYPGGTLSARMLGFVAYKGDTVGGRYGLERNYDNVLSRAGADTDINFFAEVFSQLGNTLFHSNQKSGDIVTTIEPTVQAYLDKTMSDVLDTHSADESGAIVINPKNGEIIAMSSMPGFDLNEFQKVKDPLVYANPLVEKVYEVGSIIKTVTMASGIDAGVVTPETKYDDKGFVVLNNKKINNFDKKARGIIPMQEVINQSLNTGAVFVMQKLGKDLFRQYFKSFGFGEKSGIDMPGEINSLTANLESPRDVEYATASFGQGIALVPMQAVRAFSAIANGGTLVTPHIVKEIHYKDGTIDVKTYPTKIGVIKKETSETMAGMLTKVVDTNLFNGKMKFEHYSVAGKTGTAQMAKPDGTGYYENRFMHTMYGYYPAYDPMFLVFMYNTNPKGVNFAVSTLGKPFMDTAQFLLSYYDVPPDR